MGSLPPFGSLRPGLDITIANAPPATVVVTVAGEIDVVTADQLGGALIDAMDEHRPSSVEVDFTEVPFIDSSGIAALVLAYQHAQADKVRISLTNVQPIVHRTLGITGLLEAFTVSSMPDTKAG